MVRSAASLDHTPALNLLSRRGPDFTVSKQIGNVFVAQTVLHITGDDSFYHYNRPDAFAYNGEIYNYRWFGKFKNDVELAYWTARNNPLNCKFFDGPWAWCYANADFCSYAADPQGERSLYHYQDSDILIVCSEVAPILTYLNPKIKSVAYQNKSWSMIEDTPWQGIKRCLPGQFYVNGQTQGEIDSIFSWVKTPLDLTLDEALEEFESRWSHACSIIRPEQSASVSYSGGIDSELVRRSIPNLNLLTLDIVGKDPIVDQLDTPKIPVDPETWAENYRDLINATMMPAQSWSHVGKWLIAKNCPDRIIFTGLAADELFGGYSVYQTIDYSYNQSHSPYSFYDHDGLWQRCLDACHDDPRPATLLMDYWYQVVGTDASGLDRLGGYWGKETRNPFMLKTIIEFALNLPWDLRAGQGSKVLLQEYYKRRLKINHIEPKRGFAGHANDSLPWMGIEIESTGDRHRDWQTIAQKSYYLYMDQLMSESNHSGVIRNSGTVLA